MTCVFSNYVGMTGFTNNIRGLLYWQGAFFSPFNILKAIKWYFNVFKTFFDKKYFPNVFTLSYILQTYLCSPGFAWADFLQKLHMIQWKYSWYGFSCIINQICHFGHFLEWSILNFQVSGEWFKSSIFYTD